MRTRALITVLASLLLSALAAPDARADVSTGLLASLSNAPGVLQTEMNRAAADPAAYRPQLGVTGWHLPAGIAAWLKGEAKDVRRGASWFISVSTDVRAQAQAAGVALEETTYLKTLPVMENGPTEMTRAEAFDVLVLTIRQINEALAATGSDHRLTLPCALPGSVPDLRRGDLLALSDCPAPPGMPATDLFADSERAVLAFARSTAEAPAPEPIVTTGPVTEVTSYLSLDARLTWLASGAPEPAGPAPDPATAPCTGPAPQSLRTLLLDGADLAAIEEHLDSAAYTEPEPPAVYVACAAALNRVAPLAHMVVLRPEAAALIIEAAEALPEADRAALDLIVDASVRNDRGETPILMLARHGLWDPLVQLLEDGSPLIGDINARTPAGDTALMIAVRTAPLPVIRALINAGADPLAANGTGRAPVTALLGPPANPSLGPDDLIAAAILLRNW